MTSIVGNLDSYCYLISTEQPVSASYELKNVQQPLVENSTSTIKPIDKSFISCQRSSAMVMAVTGAVFACVGIGFQTFFPYMGPPLSGPIDLLPEALLSYGVAGICWTSAVTLRISAVYLHHLDNNQAIA